MTPRVALITGASSGIGWQTARLLADQKWALALVARRQERLESLAGEIEKAGGKKPLVLPADISQPDEARAAVLSTAAHFGRLDVLVNNAGILRMARFEDMSVAEMRDIFETNFWGPIETLRAAAGVMARQGGGRVVQVGSGASRRSLPYMAAYAASKFALLGLTESLRIEWERKGIALSFVMPGGTQTEMPENMDRSRLPDGYPARAEYRISAQRAARAVVKAVEGAGPELCVPWWIRPGLILSALWPSLVDRLVKKAYRNVRD